VHPTHHPVDEKKRQNKTVCGMHATLSMLQEGGTSGGEAKENRAGCKVHAALSTDDKGKDTRRHVGCTPPRRLPAHPPCSSSPPRSCSGPPILPSYVLFDSVTWHHLGCWEPVTLGCWGASLAAGDMAVTWHAWAGLSSSSGGGDVALVGGLVVVVRGR
jgi:hypothetical protein